jgi:galactose oxidase
MARLTKKAKALQGKVDSTKLYPIDTALTIVKDCATAKFDESIDVAVQLGIDARKSDQVVRGAVVLPNGEVMIIGGNGGRKFSDAASVLTPEIWNPQTETWRTTANHAVPRNYHSVALLLPDGRVWAGGGGLGGNAADHRDAEIYTPPMLYNAAGTLATRPVISSMPAKVGIGTRFTVNATPGLSRFTLIRISAVTHSVTTDQRFVEA